MFGESRSSRQACSHVLYIIHKAYIIVYLKLHETAWFLDMKIYYDLEKMIQNSFDKFHLKINPNLTNKKDLCLFTNVNT